MYTWPTKLYAQKIKIYNTKKITGPKHNYINVTSIIDIIQPSAFFIGKWPCRSSYLLLKKHSEHSRCWLLHLMVESSIVNGLKTLLLLAPVFFLTAGRRTLVLYSAHHVTWLL